MVTVNACGQEGRYSTGDGRGRWAELSGNAARPGNGDGPVDLLAIGEAKRPAGASPLRRPQARPVGSSSSMMALG